MESILSINDGVYPLKSNDHTAPMHSTTTSRRIKRLVSDNNHPNQHQSTSSLALVYQYIKAIVIQRSLYILGVLNLVLATVAIACVAQAEDHPEYFALVYISVSIFLFYMATIVFIIIVQIYGTYREQRQRRISIKQPLLPLPMQIPSKAVTIVESLTTKTHPNTRLSHSQTLPLADSPQLIVSLSPSVTETSHPILPLSSARTALLSKYPSSLLNLSKNYQSCTNIPGSDRSALIRPIPLRDYKRVQPLDF